VNWRKPRAAPELERVYLEHVGAVYAFLAYSVPDGVAEDLTSATFERVIRAWDRFDPRRGSEKTWILTIARNILVDHYRRQSHRNVVSTDEYPELLDELDYTDEHLVRALETEELRSLLSVLSERERQILALRYAADLQAADIASILELSSANVHQILSRSLRRLRDHALALKSSA
jgi:RNA polymerase sigma factor (sigma-70 family)